MASDFDRDNSIDAPKGARRDPAPAGGAGPACLEPAFAAGPTASTPIACARSNARRGLRAASVVRGILSSEKPVGRCSQRRGSGQSRHVLAADRGGNHCGNAQIWLGCATRTVILSRRQYLPVLRSSAGAATKNHLDRTSSTEGTKHACCAQGNGRTGRRKRLERKRRRGERADRAKQEAATANQFRKIVPEPVASPAAYSCGSAAGHKPPPPQPVLAPPVTAQTTPAAAGVTVAAASPVLMRETVEPRSSQNSRRCSPCRRSAACLRRAAGGVREVSGTRRTGGGVAAVVAR